MDKQESPETSQRQGYYFSTLTAGPEYICGFFIATLCATFQTF